MAKAQKRWGYYPSAAKAQALPTGLKLEAELRAKELIEKTLKPTYVQPPPEEPQFNYIDDIYFKWHGNRLYFCAQYHLAHPHDGITHFETKFARMKYVGRQQFNLAFMRYTGQWIEELHNGLSLDECLEAIRTDAWFHP